MKPTIRVIPAILANNTKSLKKLVRIAEKFTDYVQIDIMDGEFVLSRSISYWDIHRLKLKFKWEAHLMVQHPEDYLQGFKRAGAQKIIFHFEAKTNLDKVINQIRKLDMQVGLAINPKTTIKDFTPWVDKVDSLLFLSVEPGFYGAKFVPSVLHKITAFRKAYPQMEIGIDGGVNEINIRKIARTGVDVICIGSAIFNKYDPAAAYRHLKELVNAA